MFKRNFHISKEIFAEINFYINHVVNGLKIKKF